MSPVPHLNASGDLRPEHAGNDRPHNASAFDAGQSIAGFGGTIHRYEKERIVDLHDSGLAT
jgi:hypothetical protein